MTVAFLRLALAYSPDEIRGLSESRTRDFEVIQIPGRHRWIYVPHSREVDDGVNWLLPSWNTADKPGRWGRWQIAASAPVVGSGDSPLSAKGDLHTHDGAADQALPVGADGDVLTADSGEPTGLKWAAAPPPGAHTHDQSEITDLEDDLSALATAISLKQSLSEKGAANGYASLNASTKVVENPASADATPGASKIPIADGSGLVDDWVSDATTGVKGKVKLANCLGGTALLPDVIGIKETGGPTVLTFGAIPDGKLLKRVGSTVVGVSQYLELIEDKTIGTHITSFDFSSGVDGDADELHFLLYRFVKDASGAQSTYMRPNAITTNQRNRARFVGSSEGTINDTAGGILLSNNGGAANDVDTGAVWIHTKKDKIRTAESSWVQAASGGDCFRIMLGWLWNEISTNITSWRVISTATNGLGVGSYFRLYKVKFA